MYFSSKIRSLTVHRVLAALLGPVAGTLAFVLGTGVLPAQITRVANTTLTLPQDPQTFGFATTAAFPGIAPFSQPLAIVTAPGETDRLFVVEKTGRIQAVTGLSTTPVKTQFLDLSATVYSGGEAGVLGLAFHPDFANNHYFYVFYSLLTTTSAGTGLYERVARFTALPGNPTNDDILATEVPLISQYDQADNHNGGDLHFGPDGYLYVSLGDEGGGDDQFNNSQRIDKDFFSGLLRIDVDQLAGNLTPNAHPSVHPGTYKIPADNPFVGATSFNGSAVNPSSVRTEFWAVGLRNPWRFSFDTPTGRLFVGDVGQDTREEIDLITRGGNYGWNYREGTIARPGSGSPPAGASFIDPIWDTDRFSALSAKSITGGVVYRGTRFAQLFGQYVFGDYVTSRIFAMTFPSSGPVQVQQIASENNPVAFGADPGNGDILIASISTGAIRRLVYNSSPTGTPLPATLSATGAFTDLATLTPAAGIVAYEPNVAYWSDYALKRRWFSVPALADKITFAADGNWTYPAGTVWMKHFELELTRGDPASARRLETRFLVKTAGGIYGVTYKWNTAQTQADLVPEAGLDEIITINDGGILRPQTWRYPSRSECLQCHTTVAGLALSFNTAQLNHSYPYGSGPANQLAALAGAGYFSAGIPDPATLRALAPAGDTTATLEHRARSYFAANCIQCHQPGGASLGYWDARLQTPTAATGLINGPLVNSLGDAANRVIVPGDGAHSVLLTRISTRGALKMPPLASYEMDPANIALITAWIGSLNGAPAALGADFNGDGKVDLLWQNMSTGERYVWLMNGTTYLSSVSLGVVSPQWVIAGTGDFNGDGKTDLLWQNTVTGERAIWLMNGTAYQSSAFLGVLPPLWAFAGTGDFNGDGQTDLLWQNTATGERSVSLMNGTTFQSTTIFGVIPTQWVMAGTGDFNGDGRTDILWQNTVTGERAIWLMNGTTYQATAFLGVVPTQWVIAGTGDFNGDGRPDIRWQNTATGERYVWLMNGTVYTSSVFLGVVPVQWSITP